MKGQINAGQNNRRLRPKLWGESVTWTQVNRFKP